MSYILIVILTVSGVQESYLRITPDLESCMFSADTVKSQMHSVQAEWRLRTRCVPVLKTQGI
jgi:hypothetical protein